MRKFANNNTSWSNESSTKSNKTEQINDKLPHQLNCDESSGSSAEETEFSRSKRVPKKRKQFTYDSLGSPKVKEMSANHTEIKLNPECQPWYPPYMTLPMYHQHQMLYYQLPPPLMRFWSPVYRRNWETKDDIGLEVHGILTVF